MRLVVFALFVFGGALFGVFATLAVQSYANEAVVAVSEVEPRVLSLDDSRAFFALADNRSNGFFHPDGYFCVVTAGRSADEIARTTFHELAHYFVFSDPAHYVDPLREWGVLE